MCYSYSYYPQVNDRVGSSNKLVLNLLKNKLENAEGRWVEELLCALWAIRTSSRGSTNETLFHWCMGLML